MIVVSMFATRTAVCEGLGWPWRLFLTTPRPHHRLLPISSALQDDDGAARDTPFGNCDTRHRRCPSGHPRSVVVAVDSSAAEAATSSCSSCSRTPRKHDHRAVRRGRAQPCTTRSMRPLDRDQLCAGCPANRHGTRVTADRTVLSRGAALRVGQLPAVVSAQSSREERKYDEGRIGGEDDHRRHDVILAQPSRDDSWARSRCAQLGAAAFVEARPVRSSRNASTA